MQEICEKFKETGISPFNPNAVLKRLPGKSDAGVISDSVLEHLKERRYSPPEPSGVSKKRKKLTVEPGKSVSIEDFHIENENMGLEKENARK